MPRRRPKGKLRKACHRGRFSPETKSEAWERLPRTEAAGVPPAAPEPVRRVPGRRQRGDVI